MRLLKILILIAGILMPAIATAQGARFDPAGCKPRVCSESGWIYDDNSTSHTTVWRHDLGVTPRAVSILFSPDPSQRTVMPVQWSWTFQNSGNPVSIEMTRRAVRMHIFNRAPLHGVWDPGTGQWTRYREGYWKIIVYR
jgi:hypothetical protein